MCEISSENWNQMYEKVESVLKNCKFVTLDTEFSALTKSSLFDTPSVRYDKLRQLCSKIIPIQIGLTAYTFHPDNNSYSANMFTFYLFPRAFLTIKPSFVCQSDSLQFLSNYNFDFNKFIYKGVSFINRTQESDLRKNLKNITIGKVCDSYDMESLVEEQGVIVSKWFYDSKSDNKLILPNIYNKYKNCLDILYCLHKSFRQRFNNCLYTTIENEQFVLRKVSTEEFDKLDNEYNLEEAIMNDMLGFTRLFRLLTEIRKPLIGHNLLTDLILMYQSFEDNLPKSYRQFKKNINKLFPVVYDTKLLTYEVKRLMPENKLWITNSLQCLYCYFKDGYGRHAASGSPLIYLDNLPEKDEFHNAGWDSYCTGYIFIRMAHILTASKYEVTRKFMSNELFGTIEKLKNSVNLILCSIPHIQLDGDDPVSRRPPCLIVESVKNEPVNISEVTHLFSTYGLVEVKPYSSKGQRVIVAVDNFGSVRRILSQFKGNSEFQIKQYSFIKHSPVARVALWSGLLTTGAVLAWIAHTSLK